MKFYSYKEGQTPFNFLIRYDRYFGFYVYLFGLRLYWFRKEPQKNSKKLEH